MTGIINIIFPGILQVPCPTGMSCLPRFQPRLESLYKLWDLILLVFPLPHTRFCWMPMRVTGPSVLNLTAPQTLSRANTRKTYKSSKPPARVCLFIYLFPEALGVALPTSPWLHSAFVLKNPSLAVRIAAGCSLPFTDPLLVVAALNCTRQLYKGSTARTDQQELSLPFSHHLHTQGWAVREGHALAEEQQCVLLACAERPPSQTLKTVNLKTDE